MRLLYSLLVICALVAVSMALPNPEADPHRGFGGYGGYGGYGGGYGGYGGGFGGYGGGWGREGGRGWGR